MAQTRVRTWTGWRDRWSRTRRHGADSFGMAFRLPLFDALHLDVYGGLGFSTGGAFDHGATLSIHQADEQCTELHQIRSRVGSAARVAPATIEHVAEGRERRRNPRVRPKGVVAHVRTPAGTFACQVENLSVGGVFVRTDRLLPAGTTLEMNLVKPGARKALHLAGTVVRALNAEDASREGATPGMGIEFAVPSPDQVQRLQALLASFGGRSESSVVVGAKRATAPDAPAAPVSDSSAIDGGESPLEADSFGKASPEEPPRILAAPSPRNAELVGLHSATSEESARLMVQIRGLMFELGELRGRLERREAELREALAHLQCARDRIESLERERQPPLPAKQDKT